MKQEAMLANDATVVAESKAGNVNQQNSCGT
jgi:hypothetical protein